jgi:hypothetical protein
LCGFAAPSLTFTSALLDQQLVLRYCARGAIISGVCPLALARLGSALWQQ